MKKYFEHADLEVATDVETKGFETIADILQEQQETARSFIEMIQVICTSALEVIKEQETNRNSREVARLDFEKYKFEKQLNLETRPNVRTSCICKSIKDDAALPETPLATKSSESPKPKAKARSGARKKTS